MRPEELANEFNRLYRGFRQPDDALTPEKLRALYESLGHRDLSVLRDAIDSSLCESRMPTHGQLLGALERAEDALRRRSNAQRDSEAKRAMHGVLPALGRTEAWDDLHLLRKLIVTAVETGALPDAVATALEPHASRYPLLRPEIDYLRSLPAWPQYSDPYTVFIAVHGRWGPR